MELLHPTDKSKDAARMGHPDLWGYSPAPGMYLYSIFCGSLGLSPVRSWVCQPTLSLATSGCLRRNCKAYSEAVGSSFWSANLADSMAAFVLSPRRR